MKNMKKGSFALFFAIASLHVSGQEVVSTQGDAYTNGSGSLAFTIGEVVINTGTDGTNDLTQGFHQTNWSFLSVEHHDANYEATIFPNPTSETLNIKASSFENVSYTLYDAQGRLVLQDKLSSELTTIEVSHLETGNYSIVLNNDAEHLKTFKLIKTN